MYFSNINIANFYKRMLTSNICKTVENISLSNADFAVKKKEVIRYIINTCLITLIESSIM